MSRVCLAMFITVSRARISVCTVRGSYVYLRGVSLICHTWIFVYGPGWGGGLNFIIATGARERTYKKFNYFLPSAPARFSSGLFVNILLTISWESQFGTHVIRVSYFTGNGTYVIVSVGLGDGSVAGLPFVCDADRFGSLLLHRLGLIEQGEFVKLLDICNKIRTMHFITCPIERV